MGFFGNMMNNYFYGKAGQKEYTISDMPKNRFELFGAVMKVRWSSLVGINLLYMIFWIPTLIWIFIGAIGPLLSLESMDAQMAQSLLMNFLLILIPCILITGPFTAGATYVLRNWARDEHSFVWSDFWEAVRKNWKQGLGVSAISAVMPFLTYVGVNFYMDMIRNSSMVWIVPLGVLIMVSLIWALSEMVIFMMMVTYRLSFRNLLRNAVLITMGRLPHALGIKLLTLVVPAIAFALMMLVPSIQMAVLMITILLYIVYMPAFNTLIKVSYANAMCEKYMNTQIEGAQTNIGLRPEDWDDTVYRPEDDEE